MTTRSMFTPISTAVSGSCAAARMPRPSRVVSHEPVEREHHHDRGHDDEHLVVAYAGADRW